MLDLSLPLCYKKGIVCRKKHKLQEQGGMDMCKRFLCFAIALLIFLGLPLPTKAAEALPAPVEEAITQWKQALLLRYETIPSLQIEFSQESETVKERYLRVDVHCTLSHEASSRPVELTRSFHASLHSGALLNLEDLLLTGGADSLQRELTDEAGNHTPLRNWRLTEDGLILYPCRGIDKSGLSLSEDTLSRVLIWDGSVIWPNRPMLALTFDDGPSEKTPRLLDILKANNARATFFVVGGAIGGRTETLQRMHEEGHEIGGHSWNHANLTELDFDGVYQQLSWTKEKIDTAIGASSRLMRPPYGSCNKTVSSAAASLGLSVTFWNIDTLDWMYLDADKVYAVIMDEVRNGSIILCHDLYGSTVDAMERVIPVLLKQGYQLVTVSELCAR